MLENAACYPTVPAQDIERAKSFYADRLGLKPSEEFADGTAIYETAGGSRFMIFPSSGQASGSHSQLSFEVSDIEAEVEALRARGVVFEEYDMPGFKSENGIVDLDYERAAWFKDSEGNLIALGQWT